MEFPIILFEVVNKCHVELDRLSSLNLENIQVIMLPVKKINKMYLDERMMEIGDLNL